MTTVRGVFINARKTRELAADETVFLQGDAGDYMYGVVTGSVDLRIGDKTVETASEGHVFGETFAIQVMRSLAERVRHLDAEG